MTIKNRKNYKIINVIVWKVFPDHKYFVRTVHTMISSTQQITIVDKIFIFSLLQYSALLSLATSADADTAENISDNFI